MAELVAAAAELRRGQGGGENPRAGARHAALLWHPS
jgi:hypothetical protein